MGEGLGGANKVLQTLPIMGETEGPIIKHMKKNYISPLAVEVNVKAESMLATSLLLNGEKEVDTSNGGQLGKENDRQWGNLWN